MKSKDSMARKGPEIIERFRLSWASREMEVKKRVSILLRNQRRERESTRASELCLCPKAMLGFLWIICFRQVWPDLLFIGLGSVKLWAQHCNKYFRIKELQKILFTFQLQMFSDVPNIPQTLKIEQDAFCCREGSKSPDKSHHRDRSPPQICRRFAIRRLALCF